MRDFVRSAEVERASEQFIATIGKALEESGLDRGQAQGRLSYLMGWLWDRLEAKTAGLPPVRKPEISQS